MTIFYPLHALLIRELLYVTTDKRGTYTVQPRGVLVLSDPRTVPVVSDVINTEPEARCWQAAVEMEFENGVAWTVPMRPNIKQQLYNAVPGGVSGAMSFNLLGEWWIAASPLTCKAETVRRLYAIDDNRQIVKRAAQGLTADEMGAAGWLMCWPWLLIGPNWTAYTLE